MKKNLLLVFALISSFGFSQVSLRKTTKTATTHLEETMNCANWTNSYTISGAVNINVGNTDSWGSILALFFPNGQLAEFSGVVGIPSNLNSVIIGGTNINWFPNSVFEKNSYINSNNFNATLNILEKTALADIDGGNNTSGYYIDAKYSSFYLYNATNIPVNSILALETPQLRDAASAPIQPAKIFYLKWTGTEWEHTITGPTGWANNLILQEWDTNALGITEIENFENKISIYPNPTNNFITIQNKENSTENFEYNILDLTGKIVKNGNSKFNKQINNEDLTSGNYVIQIQIDSSQNFIQKILKK